MQERGSAKGDPINESCSAPKASQDNRDSYISCKLDLLKCAFAHRRVGLNPPLRRNLAERRDGTDPAIAPASHVGAVIIRIGFWVPL